MSSAITAAVAGPLVSSLFAPDGGSGNTGQAAADPFASQRAQYQTMLSDLMTGKSNTSDPSYKWRLDQGSQNLERQQAALGLTASGRQMTELQDYGQNQASQEFQNEYSRLSRLAGADVGSPSSAAAIQNGQFQQQQASAGALGNAVSGLITNNAGAIGDWWGRVTGGNAPTPTGNIGSVDPAQAAYTGQTSPNWGFRG